MERYINMTREVKDFYRNYIARMVKSVWEVNRPEAMDRGVALNMLLSNLQHEEREDKVMLYACGTLTPDELATAKSYWLTVPQELRDYEYMKILEITNGLEW